MRLPCARRVWGLAGSPRLRPTYVRGAWLPALLLFCALVSVAGQQSNSSSASGTAVSSASASTFASVSPSVSKMATLSGSSTLSRSITPSTTPTPSLSATVSGTETVSPSNAPSPSITYSVQATSSVSNSVAASSSVSGSVIGTSSVSLSQTLSFSISPSITASSTTSTSVSPSTSLSSTLSPTITPSVSGTPTVTLSASLSSTLSQSISSTCSPSLTLSSSSSVSSTVSVTSSTSPSPSRSSSVTSTVSVTQSVTSSTSVTATITPSSTPAMAISGTNASVPGGDACMSEFSTPTCYDGSGAPLSGAPLIGDLVVTGQAMAALCLPGPSSAVASWTGASLSAPITSCADDVIRASFKAGEDLGTWMWTGGNIAASIGGRSASAAVAPVLPPSFSKFPSFAVMETVYLSGVGLGRLNLTGPFLLSGGSLPSALVSLPCIQPAVVDFNTVSCLLRFVHNEWALSAPLNVSLFARGNSTLGSVAVPLSLNFSLTPVPPASGYVTISSGSAGGPAAGLLGQKGGSIVNVTLPFDAWSAAELVEYGISTPPGLSGITRLFVDGQTELGVNCSVISGAPPRYLVCPAPPGHGVLRPASISLSSLLTLPVSGNFSYEPPTVGGVLPSWFLLPPPGGPPSANTSFVASFNVTFVSEGVDADTPYIAAISIAGVPCSGLQLSPGGVVMCMGLDAYVVSTSIASGTGGAGAARADTYPIVVAYEWVGRTFTGVVKGIFVLRPTIASLSPTYIASNQVLVVIGLNFCPPDGCPTVATGITVFLGAGAPPTYQCTPVATLSPLMISCPAPTILPDDVHYPVYNVTLVNEAGSASMPDSRSLVTYPSTGTAFNATPLPASFVPSDSTLQDGAWALPLPFVMRIFPPPPLPYLPYDGPYACTLATITPGASILPIDLPSVGTPIQSNGGRASDNVVNFGKIGIRQVFNASSDFKNVGPSVTVVVSCTASTMSSILPFSFVVTAPPLHIEFCVPPAERIQSQTALPPWSVALVTVPDNQRPTGAGAPSCSSNGPLPSLPSPIQCTVSVSGVEGATVTGGSSQINPANGLAPFDALTLAGTVFASILVAVKCSIGTVSLLPVLTVPVQITGCQEGASATTYGICILCSPGTYSRGGADNCTACPTVGVQCAKGLLKLLPDFFRPPEDASKPIIATSQILPCGLPGGCLVNQSSSNPYSCAYGYKNVLCGVCDDAVGYSRVGSSCGECATSTTNILQIVAIILVIFVLLAVRIAGGDPTPGNEVIASMDGSISLRIMLGHVQMLGALKVFKTSGTKLYHQYMDWTDLLGSAAVSQGPGQCVFRPTYGATFFITLMAPILIGSVAMVFLIIFTLVVTCRARQEAWRLATVGDKKAGGSGSLVGTTSKNAKIFRLMGPHAAMANAADSDSEGLEMVGFRPPAAAAAAAAAAAPKAGSSLRSNSKSIPARAAEKAVQEALALNTTLSCYSLFSGAMELFQERLKTRRHLAILLFVAHLAYMPVVSACLKVFNCTQPIAGVRYVVDNLSQACNGSVYEATAYVSYFTLALFGAGYPIFIYVFFTNLSVDQLMAPPFVAAWGFLYSGYKRLEPAKDGNATASDAGGSSGGGGGGGSDSNLMRPQMAPVIDASPLASGAKLLPQASNKGALRPSLVVLPSRLEQPAQAEEVDAPSATSAPAPTEDAPMPPTKRAFRPTLALSARLQLPALSGVSPSSTPAAATAAALSMSTEDAFPSGTKNPLNARGGARKTVQRSPASPSPPPPSTTTCGRCCCARKEQALTSNATAMRRRRASAGYVKALAASGSRQSLAKLGVDSEKPPNCLRVYALYISKNLVWWESTVLLRKAGIVFVGNMIEAASLQIVAVSLWIVFFIAMHFRFVPYQSNVFNWTEGLSLVTVATTAVLCTLSTGTDDQSSSALAASIGMIVLNALTIIILVFSYIIYSIVPMVQAFVSGLVRGTNLIKKKVAETVALLPLSGPTSPSILLQPKNFASSGGGGSSSLPPPSDGGALLTTSSSREAAQLFAAAAASQAGVEESEWQRSCEVSSGGDAEALARVGGAEGVVVLPNPIVVARIAAEQEALRKKLAAEEAAERKRLAEEEAEYRRGLIVQGNPLRGVAFAPLPVRATKMARNHLLSKRVRPPPPPTTDNDDEPPHDSTTTTTITLDEWRE